VGHLHVFMGRLWVGREGEAESPCKETGLYLVGSVD